MICPGRKIPFSRHESVIKVFCDNIKKVVALAGNKGNGLILAFKISSLIFEIFTKQIQKLRESKKDHFPFPLFFARLLLCKQQT